MKTAEAVKAAHPHCKIVVGGHHATEMPEEVLQCRAVDYVLRGEGEVSMPKLARAVREGIRPSSIPGIAYREGDDTIRVQPPAFMQDLDAYPLPAMSLIRQKFYRRGSRGSTVVMASRGCPMRCTYCSMGAGSSVPYRRRSVETVLKEIEDAVVNQGAGFIDFEDENISLQKEWFLELLNGIQERCVAYSPELRAMNGLFPPTLDEEIIAAMQKAGFKALNLSLGTTAPEQLRRFQRPDVREAFDRALACAEKTGLEAVGYIIVGAPGQDPADSIADLLFLASRRVLARGFRLLSLAGEQRFWKMPRSPGPAAPTLPHALHGHSRLPHHDTGRIRHPAAPGKNPQFHEVPAMERKVPHRTPTLFGESRHGSHRQDGTRRPAAAGVSPRRRHPGRDPGGGSLRAQDIHRTLWQVHRGTEKNREGSVRIESVMLPTSARNRVGTLPEISTTPPLPPQLHTEGSGSGCRTAGFFLACLREKYYRNQLKYNEAGVAQRQSS